MDEDKMNNYPIDEWARTIDGRFNVGDILYWFNKEDCVIEKVAVARKALKQLSDLGSACNYFYVIKGGSVDCVAIDEELFKKIDDCVEKAKIDLKDIHLAELRSLEKSAVFAEDRHIVVVREEVGNERA